MSWQNQAAFRRAPNEGASRWPVARANCRRCCGPATRYRHHREMRGAPKQLHACRPATARAMPVPWAMSKAAFWTLWCFVLVLPWENVIVIPVLGSIPRIVGLVASAVGVVHILAQRRVRPLAWFHLFAVLFVVWGGGGAFWSIDPGGTRAGVLTYLQPFGPVWV